MANSNESFPEQVEKTLQTYLYDKAPHLPPNWQEVLVKFLPYLTILFVVMSLPVLLAAFGLGAFLSPFMILGGVGGFATYSLTLIVFAVSVVLEAVAIPGLFAKTSKAWYLLYYSTLINALYNFLSFNLVGFVVGGALSLYLLFQIKKHYTH
jgi:hypothetical protein